MRFEWQRLQDKLEGGEPLSDDEMARCFKSIIRWYFGVVVIGVLLCIAISVAGYYLRYAT